MPWLLPMKIGSWLVGYSRLVEVDESGTLVARKKLRREAIDPLLAGHRGWPTGLPIDLGLLCCPSGNLSGDPQTGRLADGITGDIITDFARFREVDLLLTPADPAQAATAG